MTSNYRVSQVASRLGISVATLNRRINEGLVPAKVYGPKTRRITRETFIRLQQYGLNAFTSR
jgi:hypothetical protein